jgi:hypothetical protein
VVLVFDDRSIWGQVKFETSVGDRSNRARLKAVTGINRKNQGDILWGQVKWSNIGLSKGSESIWGHESIWGQVKSGDIRWEQVKYCPLWTGQDITRIHLGTGQISSRMLQLDLSPTFPAFGRLKYLTCPQPIFDLSRVDNNLQVNHLEAGQFWALII